MTTIEEDAIISLWRSMQQPKEVKVTPIKKKSAKQLLLEEYKEMRKTVDINEAIRWELKKFASKVQKNSKKYC